MDNMRDLIIAMRGGVPDKCDFCGETSDELEPEEGWEWVCHKCLKRWENDKPWQSFVGEK